jgi:hypothetical protein
VTTEPKPKMPTTFDQWIRLGAWNSLDALENAKKQVAVAVPPPENTSK